MNRTELFLLIDGAVIVLVAIVFFFLRKKKQSQFKEHLWEAPPTKEETKILESLDQKVISLPSPKRGETAPGSTPGFKTPNFNGAPHEVLGLGPSPSKEEVSLAYRYWMKRYHPDHVNHLGPDYVKQALRRAEQINRAREVLLKSKY